MIPTPITPLGSYSLIEQLNDISILYVEDDKASRILLQSVLEQLVKKVYLAENGEEGLMLYQKVLPDIVLTDRYMPKMDGLTMAKEIKSMNNTQAIGLFTGALECSRMNKDEAEIIDIFIAKPINRKAFYKALIHLTDLSHNRSNLAKKVNITKNDIVKDI